MEQVSCQWLLRSTERANNYPAKTSQNSVRTAGVFDLHKRMFRREHMDEIDEQLHTCFPELVGPHEVISGSRCASCEVCRLGVHDESCQRT